MDKGEAQELLPLTAAVFNILLALSDGEARHGYGISKRVERRTGGRVRLGPGTLYGGIKRMISQGLIEETGEHSGGDGREESRRYYRITGFGHRVAAAEAERLEGLVEAARESGLLPGRGPETTPEGA